eukprot:g29649.t1
MTSTGWRIACRLILLLVAGAAGLGAFYKMILKDVEFSKLSSLQLSLPWSSAFNLTTVAEKPEGSSWSWTSVADKLQGSGSASNGSTPEELRGAESADSFQNRSMVGEVPTEEILEGPGILVASGVPAKSPFKASDDMPHWKEVVPVFVEPILMNRSNFRMVELQKGGWTVEDPMQAVFYLVCCGPVERLLALPTRPPERPYFCYDCDAILHLESCSSTMGCLTPGKTRRVAEGEAESRREWPGVPRSAPVTWPWLELPALFVGTRTCKTWVEESFHVLRVY